MTLTSDLETFSTIATHIMTMPSFIDYSLQLETSSRLPNDRWLALVWQDSNGSPADLRRKVSGHRHDVRMMLRPSSATWT